MDTEDWKEFGRACLGIVIGMLWFLGIILACSLLAGIITLILRGCGIWEG